MGVNEINIGLGKVWRDSTMRVGITASIKNGTGGASHESFEIGDYGGTGVLAKWADIMDAAYDGSTAFLDEMENHTCAETGTNGKTWALSLPGVVQAKLLAACADVSDKGLDP